MWPHNYLEILSPPRHSQKKSTSWVTCLICPLPFGAVISCHLGCFWPKSKSGKLQWKEWRILLLQEYQRNPTVMTFLSSAAYMKHQRRESITDIWTTKEWPKLLTPEILMCIIHILLYFTSTLVFFFVSLWFIPSCFLVVPLISRGEKVIFHFPFIFLIFSFAISFIHLGHWD